MHGTDPPRCLTHSRSPEELTEHLKRMGKARQQQRRVQADASERTSALAEGASLEDVLRVCTQGLKATFHAPGSDIHGTPDIGARLAAAALLLQVFPKSLRSTPADAAAILRDLASATEHKGLVKVNPSDAYRSLRSEWFDVCARYSEVRGLYAAEVPLFMIGPGESRAEVIRNEAPSFEAWKVRTEAISDTHVLAIDEHGDEVFVPRDSERTPEEILSTTHAHRER
jgi:hypothetical protein